MLLCKYLNRRSPSMRTKLDPPLPAEDNPPAANTDPVLFEALSPLQGTAPRPVQTWAGRGGGHPTDNRKNVLQRICFSTPSHTTARYHIGCHR